MPAKVVLGDVVIKRIAESLIATIATKYEPTEWTTACIVDLHAPDGGSSMGKFRIRLTDGKVVGLVEDDEIADLISDSWRKAFKGNKKRVWYGFKMTFSPDGKHEVEYNYDPSCIDDPTFIDW